MNPVSTKDSGRGSESDSVLQPGRNCWRVTHSERAAFLIDGDAYFSAFAATVSRARRQVIILGWDVASRIVLHRGEKSGEEPQELGSFLDSLLRRNKNLKIYILDWDFAMLYAFERETLPLFRFGWGTHRRLRFRLDDRHPVGASHHQKIVVVDDRVAFAGGMDLALERWDTSEHLPDDPRRIENGKPYTPFHDVQMMIDSEGASALGELARRRWELATGERIASVYDKVEEDPWPSDIHPHAKDVRIGILRTEPAYDGLPEVREVENFYLDAIASAQKTIYIENQYLTSVSVGTALSERLREKNAPEVVMVLPRECSGWLEEGTMGVLRARLFKQLKEADQHGRLKFFFPAVRDERVDLDINVHAKILIVDDRLVRVGSSNLSNRSMGLDTECDLAFEAGERSDLTEAILKFRHTLLAEHLGSTPEGVAREFALHGSLLEAIRQLNGKGPRRLEVLEEKVEKWIDALIPEGSIIDPEKPVRFEDFMQQIIGEEISEQKGRGRGRKWAFPLLLIAMLALAGLWRWTPLGEVLNLQTLQAWGNVFRDSAAAPLIVGGAFVLGGLIMLPVTLLILATALLFNPLLGFGYALLGSVLSAVSTYGIGRFMGRDTVRRIAGAKLNDISKKMARRGLIAVVLVRFLPVAPFTVVNLVAGASHIGFRDFLLGTLIGMSPGILMISAFEGSLQRAIRNPELNNILILAGVLLAAGLGIWFIRKWLRKKEIPAGKEIRQGQGRNE